MPPCLRASEVMSQRNFLSYFFLWPKLPVFWKCEWLFLLWKMSVEVSPCPRLEDAIQPCWVCLVNRRLLFDPQEGKKETTQNKARMNVFLFSEISLAAKCSRVQRLFPLKEQKWWCKSYPRGKKPREVISKNLNSPRFITQFHFILNPFSSFPGKKTNLWNFIPFEIRQKCYLQFKRQKKTCTP